VQKQLNIVLPSEADDMIGEFDFTRISQVVRNLMSNSIKFSEPEKTIKITISNYKLTTEDILDMLKPVMEQIKNTLKSIGNLRSIAEFIHYLKIKGSMLSSSSRNMVLRIKKDFEIVMDTSHLYNYVNFIDMRDTKEAVNITYNKHQEDNKDKKAVDTQAMQNIMHTLSNSGDDTLLTLVQSELNAKKEFFVKAYALVHNYEKTEVMGIIELAASLPYSFEEYMICQIIDEGPGIPQNELVAIFDKFIQSSKTNLGAGGTGLGLAICKEIILAHNGRIWAQNNPEGGAKFSFIIPLVQLNQIEEEV
jgi:signal transduction histidine kinase